MSGTKFNWFLLGLFIVLIVLFCVVLVNSPANGDKIDTLGRVGCWLGLIASAAQVVIQAFEIRKKNRDRK